MLPLFSPQYRVVYSRLLTCRPPEPLAPPLQELLRCADGAQAFSVLMDDPTGNSYIAGPAESEAGAAEGEGDAPRVSAGGAGRSGAERGSLPCPGRGAAAASRAAGHAAGAPAGCCAPAAWQSNLQESPPPLLRAAPGGWLGLGWSSPAPNSPLARADIWFVIRQNCRKISMANELRMQRAFPRPLQAQLLVEQYERSAAQQAGLGLGLPAVAEEGEEDGQG